MSLDLSMASLWMFLLLVLLCYYKEKLYIGKSYFGKALMAGVLANNPRQLVTLNLKFHGRVNCCPLCVPLTLRNSLCSSLSLSVARLASNLKERASSGGGSGLLAPAVYTFNREFDDGEWIGSSVPIKVSFFVAYIQRVFHRDGR